MRLSTLVEIAREFNIEMPEYEEETLRPFVQMMPYEPRTWQNFLGKFRTLRQFYLSPGIIRRIAAEAVIDAAIDNIKYMELRFTPKALCNITKSSYHDAVKWVCETVMDTARDYDIDVRLIVSMNRHEDVEIGAEVTQAAIDNMHIGVVGLDLAGVEAGYPANRFSSVFQRGRDAGLKVTLHAGEWEGAHSIWDAVSFVGADRIGHGIRAIEDTGVIEVLREKEIPLEVCPSSNVDSGVVADFASHQLPLLWDAGVKVTLNTDDPLVSGITLTDEIIRVLGHMPFTLDDIKRMMLNAAEAVFLPDVEKRILTRYFQQALFPQST
ncbi:MAG: adenosine deaminase [Chloroflexi bacterium AL-W]|nr:adenosine deaminase [Chloroflexi bacterium AL-W]